MLLLMGMRKSEGCRSAAFAVALAVALVQTNDFQARNADSAPVSVMFGEFQRYLKLAAMHFITKFL
jgi:hypothetical protein